VSSGGDLIVKQILVEIKDGWTDERTDGRRAARRGNNCRGNSSSGLLSFIHCFCGVLPRGVR
jgi:hypothetical protein